MIIGQNALYFEDYVLSIQYFNQVISVKPHLAEPYMYRAMAKVQLGDYQGADSDCTEAIRLNPFIPQVYYTRGFARNKLGFYQDAIDDFTKALEFSPNSWFLLLNRMSSFAQDEQYDKALEDIELYMELNPKLTALNYEKGQLQLALKDTVGAKETYDLFVEKDSKNSIAWSARGLLNLQLGDLDKALSDYDKAIKLKSTFYGDYINRGIVNVRKNNFRQALSDYDKAIEMNDESALAYYNRALLRNNLGDTNNALDDLNKVLQLEPDNMEALLSKASVEEDLGSYKAAIADYKKIIEKYPDFIPGYVGISRSQKELGNDTEARRYYQLALDIDEKRKNRKDDDKEELVADNQIDDQAQKGASSIRTDIFNRFTAQNMERAEKESKYANQIRGTVQDRYTDIVNERNFVLSYYAKSEELRQTNYYHPLIAVFNRENNPQSSIKITNNEIPLTEDLATMHFGTIDEISVQLEHDVDNADTYFNRAMEFTLIQDFVDALADLNKAISLRPDFVLAYFTRANVRYKQMESTGNLIDEAELSASEEKKLAEKQYSLDAEMVMRDYDRVISLAPDFSFAYYNKANMLGNLRDFRSAISNYTKAIEIDPGFAEAYYNRGLIYLFTGEDKKGLADLSKAGELGIYKAYNVIKRFNN